MRIEEWSVLNLVTPPLTHWEAADDKEVGKNFSAWSDSKRDRQNAGGCHAPGEMKVTGHSGGGS